MSIRADKKSLVPGYQTKISFKRHLLPPILGFATIAAILIAFNMQYFVANAQYRLTSPAITPVFKPTSNSIIINKIHVNAPVVYDQTSTDENLFLKALQDGVVHYGTTALPGQAGNAALFGHSSGVPWAPGKYKFVFTLLDKLQPDDRIIVDFDGTRYVYKVTYKEVVSPDNLAILQAKDPTKHQLELITCTPVGTSTNRLVVHAIQVSP